MKELFLILVLLTISNVNFAQPANDSIQYVTGAFGGARFYQNGQQLRPRDLISITSSNSEANALMKKAKVNYDWSQVLGAIGGFMIGWPIGTSLGGGDPNWALAVAGVGVLLAGIPITSGYKKNAIRGADIHNQGLETTSSQNTFKLELTVSVNGPGLVLSF